MEDIMDLQIGEGIVRIGSAQDTFNTTFPLWAPDVCQRAAVIAHSREQHNRPAAQVEAMIYGDASNSGALSLASGSEETTSGPLTIAQIRLLEYLAEHATEDQPVTVVYDALGFSNWKGKRIRQELGELGYLLEVDVCLKKTRPSRILIPTFAGLEAVSRPVPKARGSAVHRHFQEIIAATAAQPPIRYTEVATEYSLPSGESVDVHLVSDQGFTVGVELGIYSRPQQELHNITKLLSVGGYDRILAVALDPKLLAATRELFLAECTPSDEKKVFFVELARLHEGLERYLVPDLSADHAVP